MRPSGGIRGRRTPADRRGSGTMLNLMIMLVLLAVTAAVLGFAGYATARHQAQNAADLAALAAAQTEGSSGASVGSAGTTAADGPAPAPVCTAARRVARANGAEVTGCELVGSPFDFVVTVRAEVALPVHLPGLPDTVSAEANAAPVR